MSCPAPADRDGSAEIFAGTGVADGLGMTHLARALGPVVLLTLAASQLAACKFTGLCGDDRASAAPAADGAGSSSSGSFNAGAAAPSTSADAARAIVEADIVQLDDEQDRIYAMSRGGTLAIVDAATPGALTLMGKTTLAGEPFEMYRRGDVLLTMSNHAVKGDGQLTAPLPEDAEPPAPDATSSAVIAAVDVRDPAHAKTVATFKVPGEVADSRIVGDVLYLATYENASCWGCSSQARTLVTTFDVSQPAAPRQVDQVAFEGGTSGFDAAWSTPWKRSVVATDQRLYVGGLSSTAATTTDEGVIEVIDITDPTGHLKRGAKITMAGAVMSRWQMDESGGVLRVVSQRGAGRTSNGEQFPDVDTFRIESSTSLVRVGHATLELPRQEGLKTVRFDGSRAYAITFNQTDPLFTIDLSDPAHPTQKGELQMPGWVFHLEPRGDRLLGLGLDRNDASGNLNVSLFDVADLTKPALVQRVSFGPTNMYEDYMITNGVLAEDQDRIQKAFRIFDDGLIAVPFSSGQGACAAEGGGVQLLEWTKGSLVKRGLAPLEGNPRRAVRRDSPSGKELIAISDSNVRAFSIDLRDAPKVLADVVIGRCVPRATPTGMPIGGGGMPDGEGRAYGYDDAYRGSSCF
jgi:hypothetical protein